MCLMADSTSAFSVQSSVQVIFQSMYGSGPRYHGRVFDTRVVDVGVVRGQFSHDLRAYILSPWNQKQTEVVGWLAHPFASQQ